MTFTPGAEHTFAVFVILENSNRIVGAPYYAALTLEPRDHRLSEPIIEHVVQEHVCKER